MSGYNCQRTHVVIISCIAQSESSGDNVAQYHNGIPATEV